YTNEGEELRRIFERAKASGATTSLDMALPDPQSPSGKAPWAKILEKVLPYVDIFLPSIEEIFFMLDPEKYLSVKSQAGSKDIIDFIDPCEYSRLAAQCIEMGCKIVALKASYRGYYILTSSLHDGSLSHPPKDLNNWSNRELWCPAFQVAKIASATGSGDSSIAGFLTAYMKGLPIEKALKVANCVGFQNLHELDAVSGIKTWDETLSMIDSGKLKMNEIPLHDTGWTWEEAFDLWKGAADLG
ncbi:MAG: PfkB family carbohydrate kinase, partial [candidate division KSB1 bacterium]|nr:PfkB family carbohydrate kinase [candidate division KSB1 bacterium]